MTTEEFINKAISKHGDKYEYSKVVYTRSTDKVTIVCKAHGEFLQTPHKHNQGDGCPKCGIERIKEKAAGTLHNFLDRATKKHGTIYDYSKVVYTTAKSSVYVVKCSSSEETFYKIGKTFKQVEKRLQKLSEIGYTVDVIHVFTGTAEEMSQKEKEMHKENRDNKCIPNKVFCGMQECYNEVII